MKTLYTQLQDNLALLENRLMMIPRYVDQPESFLGTKVYSMDMIPPIKKQIEETKAAIRGIEIWREEKKVMQEQFGDTVRALWWNNPFAIAMLVGKEETRNRPTNVRGKVLICSCKKGYNEMQIVAISGEYQMGRLYGAIRGRKELNGYAIAIGNLVDCKPMTKADEDKCFVRYKPGLWRWIFEDVQEIEPFPMSGKQGWAILDKETIGKIKCL